MSQPQPEGDNSPYFDLAKKYKIKIDFRPFIKVEGISVKEFRAQKINLVDHTAIIITSKVAVDHFFRIAEEVYEEPLTDFWNVWVLGSEDLFGPLATVLRNSGLNLSEDPAVGLQLNKIS